MSIDTNVKDFIYYITLHRDLKLAILDLLDCTELNLDSMESETSEILNAVRELMKKIQYMEEYDGSIKDSPDVVRH